MGAFNLPEVGNPPSANARCYLSSYGDCSAKITREHFISRNILERITEEKLSFQNAGHFFGGKENIEIGIDDFVAKVLCDVHNPLLSDLDAAAGVAFSNMDAIAKDVMRINQVREPVRSFHVSSALDVERWLTKVYCGLVAAGKIRSVSGRIIQRDAIPPYLLDALVGANFLPSPLGLYHHAYTGQKRELGGKISFGTVQLTDGSDDVGGLLLSLGPMNFVLITSMAFGRTFKEPRWYRHPTFLFDVKQNNSRAVYLLTY